jgi:hypothetical protein
VIVFTDTADALFACDAPEMLRRFEAADADVLTAWRGDSGAIIGRASKMLELIRDFEAFLNEPTEKASESSRGVPLGAGAAWADFYKSCGASADASAAAPTGYDDRVCLSRYVAERAAAGDARVKQDVSGLLLETVGQSFDASRLTRAAAPCVFHFADPATKALMKPVAAKFPGLLV